MIERLSLRLRNSILLGDIILTVASLYLASWVRATLPLGYTFAPPDVQLPLSMYVIVAMLWAAIFLALSPQQAIVTSSLIDATGRLLLALLLAGLSFAGMLYLSPFRDFSRLQFLAFMVLDGILILSFHLIARAYFRQPTHGRWQRRVLIVGGGAMGQQLASELRGRPWTGFDLVGFVCDEQLAAPTLPILGQIGNTVQIVQQHNIDEVVFALPAEQQEHVVRLSMQLQCYPVMLHTVPTLIDLAFARTAVGTLGGIPLISLRESVLREPQRLIKRAFDVVASALLLVLLAPLLLIIALLIKFDSPGPVLFRQERLGEHGRPFQMLKFRTMYEDAERRWREVVQYDEQGRPLYKVQTDPRVTPVGRRLRRSSLDELPQLVNVLRGEMSLVGPRPEVPHIVASYESWQWQRFRIPPGMTGWWQINGRSNRPMHLHTEDDLFYVQNYSFWLDMRILLKTVLVVWRGYGAY